jgi:hypothetical protein
MNSLRQNLQAHRAADPPASWVTTDDRQSALIVTVWQGETWVLPWAQLVSARLGDDRLELTFAAALVIVTGDNLAPLLDDLAAFRLHRIRDLPADYRSKPVEGQPFLRRIEVQSLTAETRDSPG